MRIGPSAMTQRPNGYFKSKIPPCSTQKTFLPKQFYCNALTQLRGDTGHINDMHCGGKQIGKTGVF